VRANGGSLFSLNGVDSWLLSSRRRLDAVPSSNPPKPPKPPKSPAKPFAWLRSAFGSVPDTHARSEYHPDWKIVELDDRI
jgi:hypothetical protein